MKPLLSLAACCCAFYAWRRYTVSQRRLIAAVDNIFNR